MSTYTDRPGDWDKFWSNASLGTCWEWRAAKIDGYGIFAPRNNERIRAHRLSYIWLRGCIPHGLQLDHLCRNRGCVNPWHLELVTSRENTLRGIGPTAVNARKTHCPMRHPLSGSNLRVDKNGGRYCRACDRERVRRRYWRLKAQKVSEP